MKLRERYFGGIPGKKMVDIINIFVYMNEFFKE